MPVSSSPKRSDEQSVSRKIKLIFLNNWYVKLLAFLFAIILWLHVITENEYTYVMRVPVEFTMIRAERVLAEDYSFFASVKLRGNGK